MSNQAPESAAPAKIARWSLLVLVAINILNFYDRHIAGALVEPMRREFSLSDTQIGGINTAFSIFYCLFALPLGHLFAHVTPKKPLTAGHFLSTPLSPLPHRAFSHPTPTLTLPAP